MDREGGGERGVGHRGYVTLVVEGGGICVQWETIGLGVSIPA